MKVRQIQGVILLGNVVALILYSITLFNEGRASASLGPTLDVTLPVVAYSFSHILICLLIAFALLALTKVDAAQAWVLNGGGMFVAGICIGAIVTL